MKGNNPHITSYFEVMQKTTRELLDSDFVSGLNSDTIIAFNGVMTQDAVVGLGEALRSELHQSHPLSVVNKVFAIFIEMTQNVLHYSYSKSEFNGKSVGKGAAFVLAYATGYHIITANPVTNTQRVLIENRINSVNQLSPEEIKDIYLSRRRQLVEGDSKGAGLGFIDMIRRTGKPIRFKFEPIQEHLNLFYLSTNFIIE